MSAILARLPLWVGRQILPLAAALLVLSPIAAAFGAAPAALAGYLGYLVAVQLVPGALLVVVLCRGRRRISSLALLAWAAGYSLEVCFLQLLDRLQVTGGPRYLPLLPLALLLLVVALPPRRAPLAARPPWLSAGFLAVAGIALVLFGCTLFTPFINLHHLDAAAIANGILDGYPYEHPAMAGVPLYYNNFLHTHLAAASTILGVPTVELASRVLPFVLAFLCLASVLGFAIDNYRDRRVAFLVILQIFGAVGLTAIQGRWFLSTIPYSAGLGLSTLASFSLFLILIDETRRFLETDGYPPGRLALVSLLAFSLGGTRIIALAVYGAGLAALVLHRSLRRRRLEPRSGVLLALSGLAFGSVLLLVFAYGRQESTLGTLSFTSSPAVALQFLDSVRALQEAGVQAHLAGMFGFLVMMIGQLTFLAGGVLVFWWNRSELWVELDWLWLGVAAASLVACFTHQPGGSHLGFVFYGHFGLALWGARGLSSLAARPLSWRRGVVVVLLCAGLGGVQVLDSGREMARRWRRGIAWWRPPSVHPDPGYVALRDWVEDHLETGRRFAWVGGPTGYEPISGDVPGARMLGTARRFQYLGWLNENALVRKRARFLAEVEQSFGDGARDVETYQRLKDRHGVEGALVLILDQPPAPRVSPPAGHELATGRFVVYRLE